MKDVQCVYIGLNEVVPKWLLHQLSGVFVVCYQGASHEACVPEASSDAVSKVITDMMPKPEDPSGCSGEVENDDKKSVSINVKDEPKVDCIDDCKGTAERETVSYVKVKSENSTPKDDGLRLRLKAEKVGGDKSAGLTEKQQLAIEAVVGNTNTNNTDTVGTGVETTRQLHNDVSVCAKVTHQDAVQPADLPEPVNELHTVCSKTDADATASVNIGNVDNRPQTGENIIDSTALGTCVISEMPCQPVNCEKSCVKDTSITALADSEHRDQEQSTESTKDVTAASPSKVSSPQKAKKLVSKQETTTPSESPGWLNVISIFSFKCCDILMNTT